jgi:plasmid stability protein
MGQILIRNLDDVTIERLKRRARENRTSAEEEARRVLSADLRLDADVWAAEARALRDRTGPLPGPTSTELLRADRGRDDLA